jgi:hypothetical protein
MPSETITKGVDTPAYCAIDANENLWVTNIGGESVTEYLYGSKTPHIIITEVCRIRLASQSTGLTICM